MNGISNNPNVSVTNIPKTKVVINAAGAQAKEIGRYDSLSRFFTAVVFNRSGVSITAFSLLFAPIFGNDTAV